LRSAPEIHEVVHCLRVLAVVLLVVEHVERARSTSATCSVHGTHSINATDVVASLDPSLGVGEGERGRLAVVKVDIAARTF
jgi:hypothetical protein